MIYVLALVIIAQHIFFSRKLKRIKSVENARLTHIRSRNFEVQEAISRLSRVVKGRVWKTYLDKQDRARMSVQTTLNNTLSKSMRLDHDCQRFIKGA